MSSKYLSTGTANWIASTRTISGATMSSSFDSTDATYRKQIFFRAGTSLYYGRVATLVSGFSVTLLNAGSLPADDCTIAELFLVDLSEQHSYQDYVDKIKTMVKDDAGKLSQADIERMIAQAVTDYSRDNPLYVRKKISGNNTTDYNLREVFGSLWVEGYSYIRNIEYPFGEKPGQFLEPDEWTIYDSGTAQDGSNKVLRFQSATPGAGESAVVEFRTEMELPSAGAMNFPDTDENFTNITLLGSAYCCNVLAAAYAQSADSTISIDIVNYNDKTRKYSELARVYLKRYNQNVFGQEEPVENISPVMIDRDIDLSSTSGGTFVFHGRGNR